MGSSSRVMHVYQHFHFALILDSIIGHVSARKWSKPRSDPYETALDISQSKRWKEKFKVSSEGI